MAAVQIEVTVYDDGGTSVRVPPLEGERLTEVLRAAATALARQAEWADSEGQAVPCPLCGVRVEGVAAGPDGATVLRPCGHTVA